MPRTIALLAAGITALSLAGTGCSAQPAEPNAKVTLKLSTWGNFGYPPELLKEFEAANPNIQVVHNIAANGAAARTALFTKLAANSGLADVEGVESNWTVDLAQYASRFYPVPKDEKSGDWIDFQKAPVTAKDGSLFAYGVAIGPSAICYRSDLFQAAGLPTEPDKVAALLKGDWKHYFDVGTQYLGGGGKAAWFDSANSVYGSMIQQTAYPYEKADGTMVAATNPEVVKAFRDTLAVAPKLSAGLTPFTDDWRAAMNSGGFATIGCPSWMLGLIQGAAPKVTTWKVANVFPNGGGNAGGSYLAVPRQTQHPKEAAALASWLTAPEQQIKAFKVAGPFPSRVAAYDSPALQDIVNPYFGNAPVGKIFTDRAKAINGIAYKGPRYFKVLTAMTDAITRVEDGTQSVDGAWTQFVGKVGTLK